LASSRFFVLLTRAGGAGGTVPEKMKTKVRNGDKIYSPKMEKDKITMGLYNHRGNLVK
jgi:hypothetical protein